MSSAIYVVRQEKGISLVPPCWTETIGQRKRETEEKKSDVNHLDGSIAQRNRLTKR